MKQHLILICSFKSVFVLDLLNLVPGTMNSEIVSPDEINDGEIEIT